jgi:hypothetical protein
MGVGGRGDRPRLRGGRLWRWLRFQPDSALGCWFIERTGRAKGRIGKIMVVALARKLLVALWHSVETGEVPASPPPERLPAPPCHSLRIRQSISEA